MPTRLALTSTGDDVTREEEKKPINTRPWRIGMVVGGILLLASAVVLEIVALKYHAVTQVVKETAKSASMSTESTTTTKGPAGPPTATVATAAALGTALILVAAFFNRVTKISAGGVDLELAADVAAKAAAKSGGDSTKAAELALAPFRAIQTGRVEWAPPGANPRYGYPPPDRLGTSTGDDWVGASMDAYLAAQDSDEH